jgi:hypothetical protein
MAHNNKAGGNGGEERYCNWPHTLNKDNVFEIIRSGFMVPSDMLLLDGWKINAGGYPISSLPTGRKWGCSSKHTAKIYQTPIVMTRALHRSRSCGR